MYTIYQNYFLLGLFIGFLCCQLALLPRHDYFRSAVIVLTVVDVTLLAIYVYDTDMNILTCTYIYIHKHTYMHTYIHTFTHTYLHVPIPRVGTFQALQASTLPYSLSEYDLHR